MPATVVETVITASWGEPDATDQPTGEVQFDLTAPIQQPEAIAAKTVRTALVNGGFVQELMANDADSGGDPLFPATTQYYVTERILGAPEATYFITVPAVPPGSRQVTDGVLAKASTALVSATANFTQGDVNAYVNLPGFPVGTQILTVTDSTHAALSTASQADATGVAVLIGASATLSELRPQML